MKDNIVISLKSVSKTFKIKDKSDYTIRNRVTKILKPSKIHIIEALKNINLEIKEGDFFGIIGRNGSGKSTLLKIMSQVYPPDKGGKVDILGKYLKLTLGTGFDGELTAKENIYLNASLLGLTFKRIGNKFQEIIEFAELKEFVNSKVKYFSSGMYSRLAFAVAVHAEADIFLIDEFFGGVGDEKFKQKSDKVFRDSILKGKTVVFVSHDLNTIKENCNKVLLLNFGEPILIDTPEKVLTEYNRLLK